MDCGVSSTMRTVGDASMMSGIRSIYDSDEEHAEEGEAMVEAVIDAIIDHANNGDLDRDGKRFFVHQLVNDYAVWHGDVRFQQGRAVGAINAIKAMTVSGGDDA
jgi:hypothetical protein